MAFNFIESDNVKKKKAEYDAADAALKNFGDFNYSKQADYDSARDAILKREKFSYDMNSDALYQQYKDQYTALGKLAMQDTMGQAAALTGGYGNSYASTAGNQAYQSYLQQLNQMVPELYSLALQNYNTEGDRLLTNYNLLGNDRQFEQSEYDSKYNILSAERSNAYNIYNDTYDREYTDYTNKYNANYQAEQDAIAQKFAREQFDWEKSQSGNSSSDNSSSNDVDLIRASYEDEDGLIHYTTMSGKKFTAQKGVNPYTNVRNPDVVHGTFSNGYQPDNIGGIPIEKAVNEKGKTLAPYNLYGKDVTIWKLEGDDSGKLWVWDGPNNTYRPLTEVQK